VKRTVIGRPDLLRNEENPVARLKRTAALTQLVDTLVLVRERRLEWERLGDTRALLDGRPEARLRAVTALGEFPLAWKLPLLRECRNEVWQVRLEAARQLVREPKCPRGRGLLKLILSDGDSRVRVHAALSIMATDELWRLDPDLFTEAITRIEKAKEPAAVPYLRPLLRHTHEAVRVAAVKAMAACCPPGNRAQELLLTLVDSSEKVCLVAVDALQQDDSDASVRQLAAAFRLPQAGIRRGAADAVEGLLQRHPSIAAPIAVTRARDAVFQSVGFVAIFFALYGDFSGLWGILPVLALLLALCGRTLVRERRTRAAALEPLLTALRDLPEDAPQGEFDRLLRPIERVSRDFAGQSPATRKAARDAAARLRRIQGDPGNLPVICSGEPDTDSLPRVSAT